MALKPPGFYFEDDNEEEIDNELNFNAEPDQETNSGDELNIDQELSEEEVRRRYAILQILVYNKDRIITNQVKYAERLERENESLQNQYQMLYNAFSGLSEKAKDMLKREKVLKLFLKTKKFGIEDIDEFINEIRVTAHYKNKLT